MIVFYLFLFMICPFLSPHGNNEYSDDSLTQLADACEFDLIKKDLLGGSLLSSYKNSIPV